MSNRKPKSDARKPRADVVARRFDWRMVAIGVLLAAGGASVWEFCVQPRRLFAEAQRAAPKNPQRAEQLAADALARSWGNFPAAALLRAEMLGVMGHWDEAHGQFSLIPQPRTLPPDDLCRLAAGAQANGALSLAEAAFRAASDRGPRKLDVLRSLIQIHLGQGQEELVEAEAKQLVEHVPDDATAWQVLGKLALDRKEMAEAEHALRRCIEHSRDPQQKNAAWEDLLQALIDAGRVADARAELDRWQAERPLTSRGQLELAYLHRLEGNPADGLKVIEQAYPHESQLSPAVRLMRGMLLDDLGESPRAKDDFLAVVRAQPWNKEAHQKLASVYQSLGSRDDSLRHAQLARELNDQSLKLLDFTSRLRKDPGNSQLRAETADLYRKLGQPEQADRLLGRPPR